VRGRVEAVVVAYESRLVKPGSTSALLMPAWRP